MQKSFQSLLLCISFALLVFTSGFAQDSKGDSGNNFSTSGKVELKTIGQIPFSTEGIVTITHSASQSIVAGSVSCNAGGLHTDNSYWRAFNLSSFGISGSYTVTDVSIGVETATSTGASQQVTCNLYTSSQVFPAGFPGSLTLIGTSTIDVTPQSLTMLNIPVAGVASAGSELVVEIFTPSGQTLGNSFFIGSNGLGQTGPSYISAATCGITTPSTTTAIGFPNMMIVMNVTGNDGAPCPVGPATDPSPVSGATNVSINPGNATWTNGAGTSQVEVFFGPAGNSVSVYSGAAITSLAIPGPLSYATAYEWKVVCKNDTCSGAPVATWTFTTEQDPLLTLILDENFETATFPPAGWTIVSTVGTTQYWTRQTTASGYGTGTASSRYAFYSSSAGNDQSLITPVFSPVAVNGSLQFDHAYATYTGNENDRLQLETSSDGGATWNILITLDGGPSGPLATAPPQSGAFTPTAAQWATKTFSIPVGTNMIKFRALSAFGNNLWVDNIKLVDIVPVELTSFAATTDNRNVTLNWSTATELNNSGFQVERSNGSAFEVVGFVAGHGTTTEVRNYNFVDQNVASGSYSYRLKQVDFNGTFEYSNVIEVEVVGVKEFTLGQNYPNPFNPSTKINFSLAVDSKVSLKIFDVLGQEVVTLLNGQLAAGSQEVSFDASSLNSGVYFYRIDASGVDGQKFSSTKKMILTK
jgi:hypothetical protein